MTAGDHFHGDVVHMNQTTDSVGIDKRTMAAGPPPTTPPDLEQALATLLPLLQELRRQLGQEARPLAVRTVEAAEADITATAEPETCRTALERIGGIAETAGPAGAAVLAVIHQILTLLGG
ncbi:hypothetical protein [Streptomyces exfoliatus]|uniref:hypothetical protein n=1 Tax=Streptomyces TaxID=1883 RepID=UPI0004C5BFCA|nr:hypothetical protein [Streptomyces exfoliatus]